MHYKTILLLFTLSLTSAGCAVNIESDSGVTQPAGFVTATLPPSPIPQATQTVPLPTANPSTAPVDGTTTTQVNVRAETSTASQTLGTIGQFTKVQIIGKDPSGSWFQILYPPPGPGTGWVRAEYVQVAPSAEIPVIAGATANGSGVSALVLQKINVRSGPATSFATLAELNPKDVVFITGKDSSGAWMQIEFAKSPDGHGWVAMEYLQVDSVDSVSIVEAVSQPAATAGNPEAASTPVAIATAVEDGDSMLAPLSTTSFSPTGIRALQIRGDVSAPQGDREDWIQFTSASSQLMLQLTCSSETLQVELWLSESIVNDFSPNCGSQQLIIVAPNQSYFLHLSETSIEELQFTQYTLRLEAAQ